MADKTFQREIDRTLDRIGDRCDRIIDANDLSPNPDRIAKEAQQIIQHARRIVQIANAVRTPKVGGEGHLACPKLFGHGGDRSKLQNCNLKNRESGFTKWCTQLVKWQLENDDGSSHQNEDLKTRT